MNNYNPFAPNEAQIQRACRLYSAGCTPNDFIAAFECELEPEAIWLVWCAAKTHVSALEQMNR